MNIFKLGSLQFEISNLQEENIDINSDDLGDCADVLDNDVIMVHIMENEDISYESCVKSFGLADEFSQMSTNATLVILGYCMRI